MSMIRVLHLLCSSIAVLDLINQSNLQNLHLKCLYLISRVMFFYNSPLFTTVWGEDKKNVQGKVILLHNRGKLFLNMPKGVKLKQASQ